jgi:hypothetical protein
MLTGHPDASRRTLPFPIVLLVILLLWISGCGYQPHGLGSLPPEIQRVHLAALTNSTLRPGLQGIAGAAILRRLQQDGRIRSAPQEAADAVLGGTIIAYQNIPVAFEQGDIGRRFRVRLILTMQLTERNGEKILLKEEVFGEAFYTAGTDVVATRAAEEDASFRAAEDLATRVVTRLLEGL